MNKITTVGLDLAKNVFHVVCVDRKGKEVRKKMLRRSQVLDYFANLPACLVGMEACAGAHDWARRLKELGHEVRLMPAQLVKPYVSGNKNDYNDARAIAEAVTRPKMRFVAVKTVEQQDKQALHRLRASRVAARTLQCNQIRGLLAEYGIVVPKSVAKLRKSIPEILEDAENPLTEIFRQVLHQTYQELLQLDGQVEFYTRLIEQQAREDEAERRLQTIPGFGPIVASVFHATVGDGKAYHRSRDAVSYTHLTLPTKRIV
mgnify:CR=1 FL=1